MVLRRGRELVACALRSNTVEDMDAQRAANLLQDLGDGFARGGRLPVLLPEVWNRHDPATADAVVPVIVGLLNGANADWRMSAIIAPYLPDGCETILWSAEEIAAVTEGFWMAAAWCRREVPAI